MNVSKGDGIFDFLIFAFKFTAETMPKRTTIAEWELPEWFWLLFMLGIATIFYIWLKR